MDEEKTISAVTEVTVSENQILSFAEEKGIIISKESVTLLCKNDSWKELLEELVSEGHFIIDNTVLEKKLTLTKISQALQDVEIRKTSFAAQAKERPANFRVMEEYDITGQSTSEGSIDDFLKMFRSKYELLSTMLKERHNLSPVPLKSLEKVEKNAKVDVIGMVNKKWVTKNGHLAFEIEDLETRCIALIMEKEKELTAKGEHVLEDNVVGIKGAKVGNEFIIINEIYWPDLPMAGSKLINEEVYIGGISDLHVGSPLFYEDKFKKLLEMLNGKGITGKKLEQVGKIQYLMVPGDNVAGIGVYPGQLDELLIKDLYEQYARFEDLLLEIPEYIQVFICPGQHDAVRRAEPQPGISKEFVPRLSKLRNFHFISSPSWVEIEGLKNLVYHGASIHDLISSVSFLEMSKPQDGMVELLKKRDLMPHYGGKNPYVPEKKDYMAIKEVPDLVWIGDMHTNGYATYRGTTVLNSGCWEGKTSFQEKIGHKPTPCVFPIINLQNRKIFETHFLRETAEELMEGKQ
ncbi:MAG: metallophosphoesterase [archaeon]